MQNPLSQLVELLTSIAKLPVAKLEFRLELNPDHVQQVYTIYTKRHPRYKVIRNKSLGAALVHLRRYRSRSAYIEAVKGGRYSAEHYARKAKTKGYRLIEIDRNHYIDDIHAVHTSVDIRQGQPMDAHYLEKQTHYVAEKNFKYYGVLNAAGQLMAYSELGFYGNFAAFNRVIGVRNNDGVMHMMVTEIICQLIDDASVNYLMYDTYFGASPGLKKFKTMLGFQPYRAKYSIQ